MARSRSVHPETSVDLARGNVVLTVTPGQAHLLAESIRRDVVEHPQWLDEVVKTLFVAAETGAQVTAPTLSRAAFLRGAWFTPERSAAASPSGMSAGGAVASVAAVETSVRVPKIPPAPAADLAPHHAVIAAATLAADAADRARAAEAVAAAIAAESRAATASRTATAVANAEETAFAAAMVASAVAAAAVEAAEIAKAAALALQQEVSRATGAAVRGDPTTPTLAADTLARSLDEQPARDTRLPVWVAAG